MAKPIGINMPEADVPVRIATLVRIGSSRITIGVLLTKALRVAPTTRVASNDRAGLTPHSRASERPTGSRVPVCAPGALAGHHQGAYRDQSLVAEAMEESAGVHRTTSRANERKCLEAQRQHCQHHQARGFERHSLAVNRNSASAVSSRTALAWAFGRSGSPMASTGRVAIRLARTIRPFHE